ncbi:uncharacterized protein V6R79_006493 [Siganus canaliculatus]
MARRSQCSSAGDNPLDPNYLPPHYREEYRLAIDALVEEDLEGYYQFLQKADVVDFLSSTEIQYIQTSVQVPTQSNQPEQRFVETGGDGSSDTYWPIHSDLDAPGLDLGWPQIHPSFIGPTEVTTLVNPPEPDMPSIKEQARRLIKNAHQVIAVAMDMFTDVDILHDILNAAMRNVAVYIILDEQNAHHFINMVSNCRVNLQSFQFLRVRIVPGITYHCRSGKSFKGQMMDRFLLTDCRAVLSGNYSFMWSFEKLHRCTAHLFLGQLVSTFDEEFRILYAQSQPLLIENAPAGMDDFSLLQKRPYPSERLSLYGEPRKFLPPDANRPDEWVRHSYDDRMDVDWRMMPLKRRGSLHSLQGPADVPGRFPSQQSRLDPAFDQGPSRMPMVDNPAFKRHSYAEGGQGRYSYPFLPQQGMPESETPARHFQRRQQPYPGPGPGPGTGKESDYAAYDKFWNQDYLLADQYSEHSLPQEMDAPDFDPVLNYLSSATNVDFDQGSDKLPPAEFPSSSSQPRRLSLGQPHACQTSPAPSNPTEQKQFFQEPNLERKDPAIKRGLRDWRISSYLSAYDSKADEGLPLEPQNLPEPFEDPPILPQRTTPGVDLTVPKIPNVREFRVPAIPRASQMPCYAKSKAREQPKKLPDESAAPETKTTPTSSESSSTAEAEKTEEAEPKAPKAGFPREESFRRKLKAAAPRSSRLRSSLIFSSLDQQHSSEQQDEEGDKTEEEQSKHLFASQVLGQKRSTREPFEWSRFKKSATVDHSATDASKADDGSSSTTDESSKGHSEKPEIPDSSKPSEVEATDSSPSLTQSKPSDPQLPKQPPKSLLAAPSFVDMSDPDNRLMFFKELAAKRKAAKAAEAEKSKEKAPMKPPVKLKGSDVKKEEENAADTAASEHASQTNVATQDGGKTEECGSVSQPPDAADKMDKAGQAVHATKPNQKEETRDSTDSEKIELKSSQTAAPLSVSAEPEAPDCKPPEKAKTPSPAVTKSGPSHPSTPTTPSPAEALSPAQDATERKNQSLDSTSNASLSLTSSAVEEKSSSKCAALDLKIPSPKSVHVESPSIQTSTDHTPNCSSSTSAAPSTAADSISSSVTPQDSSSGLTSSSLPSDAQGKSIAAPTPSETDAAGPQNSSDLKPSSSKSNDAALESDVSDVSDQKDRGVSAPSQKDSELSPAAVNHPVHPDPTPDASQSVTSTLHEQGKPTPPSKLELTGPATSFPAEAASLTSPLAESVGKVLSPEAEKTLSKLHNSSNTECLPEQVTTHSIETQKSSAADTCSPTEHTSEVPKEADPSRNVPASVPAPVPAENGNIHSQNEGREELELSDSANTEATEELSKSTTLASPCSEKTYDQIRPNNSSEQPEITSEEVVPPSPQSKQPKSGQSRYHSSTANVLSSSNLRDDTKLLLEQISANSQSRNEAAKEAPVTDDEKEDEADKNAKKEKGLQSLSRGQSKPVQERDKVLERIQSMRKERRVYSRFDI